jgi:hypothetical protein
MGSWGAQELRTSGNPEPTNDQHEPTNRRTHEPTNR